MMHLKITDEIRERCLREAAHEAHINDRIVTSTPQTLAERGMTMFGSTRATPRIRSYLSTVTRWMPASIMQERCPVSLWPPAGRLTARTSPRVLKSRKSPLRSCAA